MICVLFANLNLKLYLIFSTIALIPTSFGLILSPIGAFYRIKKFPFLSKTFYLEFYSYGTAEEAKPYPKFKDFNRKFKISLILKEKSVRKNSLKKMVACSYIVKTRYNCYCKLENPVNMCYIT